MNPEALAQKQVDKILKLDSLSFEDLSKLILIEDQFKFGLKPIIQTEFDGIIPIMRPDPNLNPYLQRVNIRLSRFDFIFKYSFASITFSSSLTILHNLDMTLLNSIVLINGISALLTYLSYNPFGTESVFNGECINPEDYNTLRKYLTYPRSQTYDNPSRPAVKLKIVG